MKTCPMCEQRINDNDTSLAAIDLVIAERIEQDAKWGANRNLSDKEWLTILVEEVGESAKAILEDRTSYKEPTLPTEVVHVAAVAVAWLEGIQNRRKMGI